MTPLAPADDLPPFLRTNDACAVLDITRKTLRRLVADGAIPAYRVGGSTNLTRYRREDVLALLRPVVPSASSVPRDDRAAQVGWPAIPMDEHTSCGCPKEFASLEPSCHYEARHDGWVAGFVEGHAAAMAAVWRDVDAAAARVVATVAMDRTRWRVPPRNPHAPRGTDDELRRHATERSRRSVESFRADHARRRAAVSP